MDSAQAYRLLQRTFPGIKMTAQMIDYTGAGYIQWEAEAAHLTLDGDFTPEQLQALAVWVTQHYVAPPEAGPGR